jgi:hypothetical protein
LRFIQFVKQAENTPTLTVLTNTTYCPLSSSTSKYPSTTGKMRKDFSVNALHHPALIRGQFQSTTRQLPI